jgi:hemin uptake protein HemP
LAFIEWETRRVSAETAEEALEIARKIDDEDEWDGCLSNRERIGSKDTLYPIKLQRKEYRMNITQTKKLILNFLVFMKHRKMVLRN